MQTYLLLIRLMIDFAQTAATTFKLPQFNSYPEVFK